MRSLINRKNRKGMLLASEVLKMVLSVISIGLLIYLLVSLYYNNVEGKKKDEASQLVERIKDIMERIESSNNVSSEVIGEIVPSGWYIFSYTGEELKPNSCSGNSCFCICDDVWVDVFDRQIKECGNDGVCSIRNNLIEFEDIEILDSGETSIEIYKDENFVGIRKA